MARRPSVGTLLEPMPGAVPILGVSHVSIYVSDVERSLRFYRDVFGFEVIFDDAIGGAGLFAIAGVADTRGRAVGGRIGDLRVELLDLSNVPRQPRPPGLGLAVLSIRVPDADAAYAAVQKQGYRCRSAPIDVLGTRMFFALDPDGQGIEMVEYPKDSPAWGGAYAPGGSDGSATAEKFGYPRTLVAEWPRWRVLLRPAQPTLGSLVLVCREPVGRFGAISSPAAAELREVVAAVERALGELLRFDKINYLMLMMVDPDVHFHVLPRYASARRYAGEEFADPCWPGPPDLTRGQPLPEAVQAQLLADLRAQLAAARA